MRGLRLGLGLNGGRAFTPASLFASSEPGAWYDPSDLSTMFQDSAGTVAVTADGDPVRRINDKSGNGHALIAPTDGQRPLYKTAAGKHWLEFDGTDDQMESLGWGSISQPIDRLCALQQDSWSSNRYIFDGGVADEMLLRQNNTTASPDLSIYAGAAACNNSAGALGVPHYVAERYNGASSSLTIGSTVATGNAGANALTGLVVGGRRGGAPFCPVKMFGIIVRGGTMSAAELDRAHAWLSGKSGAA